ncbi:MAG: hypothetical protein V1755_08765 [Chloroflexota bacterium]
MSRWVVPLVLAILGLTAGLAYGWVIAPVEYVDTIPASLRADYRTDYVLMVAERFHAHRDPEAARRQLSVLGGQSPAALCEEAISFAQVSSYARQDLELLHELNRAMQALSSPSTPVRTAP